MNSFHHFMSVHQLTEMSLTHCVAFTMSKLALSSMCERLFGCWLMSIA